MKKTYGLPTFFAFYVFFVWSTDGEIQFYTKFIDQASCEAVAKTFKEEHAIYWKKNKEKHLGDVFGYDDPDDRPSVNVEGADKRLYPKEWKGKCIPASEWPF